MSGNSVSDSPPDTLIVNRCTTPRGLTAASTIQCAECKLDCWIAPTSIAALKRWPMIRVVCLECTVELARKHGSTIKEISVAPGAAEEIAEAIARDKRKRR